jgi:hypothetical protein
MLKKISKVFILSLALMGCEQERDWNGGFIDEYPDPIPDPPPVCAPVDDPYDWEPDACAENEQEKRCYWQEQMVYNDTTTAICLHEWSYDKWDCEWIQVLSGCQGGNEL